ncbi:MAG TPA: carboxymuconolactone decarboxylase family protein [Pirellulales bacterium]|jgi:AhpD family alkylhydroperoxidase
MTTRANYSRVNHGAFEALSAVNKQLTPLDPKLRALVELRVSQINGCVYCVDLHSNQARGNGETQQRLDCLCVWQECPFFDEAERAALGWAESLTYVSQTHAPDAAYEALGPHFSEQQIVDLSLVVATMNAWNRLAIGHRSMPPKRSP